MKKFTYAQECALECLHEADEERKQALDSGDSKKIASANWNFQKSIECYVNDLKLITLDDYKDYLRHLEAIKRETGEEDAVLKYTKRISKINI